jgi:hypothetical protein
MDDRKDIIGKFLFGGTVSGVVEDDETCVVLLKDKSQEVKGETTQSVSMGNNKLFEMSRHRSFQKGLKTLPFPIDSRSNV